MRYLTLLSLALSLYAQTLFIPQSWIDAEGRYSTEQSYCQNLPAHKAPFCEKSSLSYPVFTQAPDPVVAQQIARIVTPRITEEKKRDLKKEVLSIVSDFKQDPPDGTWYNEESISLFALTPQTFTIRTTISNYTGGAHGSYTVGYTNYLKGDTTNTPLTLDDLLVSGYEEKLIKIAASYYKKLVGLKPTQSLTADGWFEDRFVLPSEIAITPNGLLFHYNSYEIKAYADGHTSFLLPYFMFRKLIRPQSAIGAYTQSPKVMTAHFNAELGDLHLKTTRTGSRTLKIETAFRNTFSVDALWLSLSFPQLKNQKSVQQTDKSGLDTLHVYPAKSPLYHIGKKKSIRSRYLLIEAEQKKLKYGTLHTFDTTIRVPASLEYLRIDLRAVTKDGQKLEHMPDEFEGVTGQQGFHNYELVIPLRD